jgi:regulator of sigma E protease
VGIHELGHFLTARLVGVKVQRFSIGFGKVLYRWQGKKGTEYVVAAIPLGGYVKMLDENEGAVPKEDLPYAYNNQPFYKKFAIVVAGPLANLIFAFVIYWFLFVIGFVGMVPVIGKIIPNSIAAEAGMIPNQEIIQIDNEPTKSWIGVMVNILMRAGDDDRLRIITKDLNSNQEHQYKLPLTNWRMDDLKPDPLESLGFKPYEPELPPIVGVIAEDSPAKGLLKPNDKIKTINGIVVTDWYDLAAKINKYPDAIIDLQIERNNKLLVVPIRTLFHRDFLLNKHGYLGIAPAFKWPDKLLRQQKYGPLEANYHAWQETKVFVAMNFIVFGKLLTGKVSLGSLGGPITIFESAGTAINHGFLPFLSFLAFISIAIGIVNILPIPGLDGGHLLFQVIEVIIRRPLPNNVQLLLYRLGLIILFLLLTQAIVNDILRL